MDYSIRSTETKLNFLNKMFLFLFTVLFALEFAQAQAPQCLGLFTIDSPIVTTQTKWEQQAESLGLSYVKPLQSKGYQRIAIGSRTYKKKDGSDGKTVYYHRYLRPDGTIIRPYVDAAEFNRVRESFNEHRPDPRWPIVWIAESPDAHIQMWAKTADGKRFATYHEDWTTGTSHDKYNRVETLQPVIAKIRSTNKKNIRQLNKGEFNQSLVESVALELLLSGRIRVGTTKYRDHNGTYGVTTLLKEQVQVNDDGKVFLTYIGKSGNKDPENPVFTEIEITDSNLKMALVILKSKQPENPNLMPFPLTSIGLNRLLNDLQADAIRRLPPAKRTSQRATVKDLRTWAANVAAIQELIVAGPPATEPQKMDRIFQTVAKKVSQILNNTPGICRKNYIDPRLLNAENYEALWNLAATKFPELIQKAQAQVVDEDPVSKNYDPRFESLAAEFFERLRK